MYLKSKEKGDAKINIVIRYIKNLLLTLGLVVAFIAMYILAVEAVEYLTHLVYTGQYRKVLDILCAEILALSALFTVYELQSENIAEVRENI